MEQVDIFRQSRVREVGATQRRSSEEPRPWITLAKCGEYVRDEVVPTDLRGAHAEPASPLFDFLATDHDESDRRP